MQGFLQHHPRVYTRLFGENLMKAYEEWRSLPPEARADCRGRQKVDLATTDREIFESLSLGDVWVDSRIHEVFLYLYGCKNVQYLGCI